MLAVGHDVKKNDRHGEYRRISRNARGDNHVRRSHPRFTSYWQTILGLIIGGVCAAPLAAWICKKIPVRPLLAVVGILIIVLNFYSLLHYLAVF